MCLPSRFKPLPQARACAGPRPSAPLHPWPCTPWPCTPCPCTVCSCTPCPCTPCSCTPCPCTAAPAPPDPEPVCPCTLCPCTRLPLHPLPLNPLPLHPPAPAPPAPAPSCSCNPGGDAPTTRRALGGELRAFVRGAGPEPLRSAAGPVRSSAAPEGRRVAFLAVGPARSRGSGRMRSLVPLLGLWGACCCMGGPAPLRPEERLQGKSRSPAAEPAVRFNLRTSMHPEHEGCYLTLGHNQSLAACGFNATAKTFFILHGWTMSGLFENWLYTLVSALQTREKDANIVVVDWLPLAHKLYMDAVNNTRVVGHSLARMLDWLQEKDGFDLGSVHLIGYSLGAHVAGYAGNFVNGTVGRITGLDPAGPLFEGADIHQRLSPDDADFVDVLHTYTRSFGLSIGIQMPVGHVDIYPNGGDFQPGCGLSDVLGSIASGTLAEVMKCEHERAVHLFVDSLVNEDKPSFAFQCTDSKRFKKGICLSCRKNRCNSIGYNAKKMRNKRNSKMYLKTRASMPFRVYHYQMKMRIFSHEHEEEIEPSFYVTLYGTNANSQTLPLEIVEQIGLNTTNTFLVYTEEDLGDLLKVRLGWEDASESWYSFWKELRSYLLRSQGPGQELSVRRIRVKSGETQKKLTFCAEDPKSTSIAPGRELWFLRCLDDWGMKNGTSPPTELP